MTCRTRFPAVATNAPPGRPFFHCFHHSDLFRLLSFQQNFLALDVKRLLLLVGQNQLLPVIVRNRLAGIVQSEDTICGVV